jgi:peptidoglycan/xylan/chitin deacetylase (PgdA/CDA1 family)
VLNKKALVARAMAVLALPQMVTRLRGALRHEVTILAYHRILDITARGAFEFDLELVSASVADFRWQMEYLRRHYAPITFRQLIQHLDGDGPIPPRPIIVTFDDGFDDNYHHAFPVLKSLEMPATMFLSTGYIGQTDTFWFDWLVHLCHLAGHAGRSVQFAGLALSPCADTKHECPASAALLAYAKTLPDHDLRIALLALERELGVCQPPGGNEQSRPMTWEQVREMAAAGIEFGSHTVTHPILSNTAARQLDEELAGSKQRLEQELQRPMQVIAYPVGGELAFDQRVIDRVRAVGYRLGVSYIPGVNVTRQINPYGLRRLRVERYTQHPEFAGMLAVPELLS